jgi:tetratricopeptide (TPR) repeat protein
MKTLAAAVFFFLFSFGIVWAQQAPSTTPQPAGQTPPSSAQPTPGKDANQSGPAQAPADYSQQAFVIEYFKESMRFENDGAGVDETEARIKIISESGVQSLGQLKIGYSALSDKLDIDYVRVRKADGTVVLAQESAVQDMTFPDAPVYTDYHEKHISVPSLRPGDVLEYRFVRTIVQPLTPGQFWASYSFRDKGIVLDEQLEINVPKDRQITLKTKTSYTPTVSDEGDRRIYRWKHSRLTDDYPGKKKEKPPKPADQVPTVQLTTFRTWQEVGTWYAGLERERRIPDSAVKAEADVLVKGKTDDMAKVKALYDYVSRNIRYVSLSFGLGRIQPHAASEVLANGYGDCKDKNTLLAALLDAEGFKSTSVLIGSQRKLDPEVPSPMQFDHVITRVPVDGKEIWLDSTPGVAPFRMLSANLRGKQALAISPDGKAELVWTPTDLPFQVFDRTTLEGTVSDAGKLTAHVTIVGRSDTEMQLRFAMRRMPSSRWKDLFDYMLTRTKLKGAEITNVTASDPSATDDPMKVEFDVTAYNYFDWSAPDSKFSLPLSTISLPSVDEDDDDADKREPIQLGPIADNQADVKLTFPPKYKVHPPIDVDVKRDYSEYHSIYKYENDVFTSKRTIKVLQHEIPQSRDDDYAAFRRVVMSDAAQVLSLENTQPGASAAGGSESAADLNNAAIQALNNQRFDLAADLLQKVVKLDPKYKSAWDNLGRAYLALGKREQAADAFQKQLEMNPYDEFAYNGLGLVYQQQGKYAEAVKLFEKQIEINPLDQNAHANLGNLYVNQKRYAEAVPELEKATSILSKNALLQIQLGQAYIATNQTDKGMAAFEKAIALAPVPVTWNNIAYSLSQQGIQLDRAEKYADAAINAVETQLHDVTLDKMRIQDLATTNFLFNTWDTKGWIAFKRGNLDAAQAYIMPAFLASGRGGEAEHMGEIYEKQGRKDEAIKYYIFARVSEEPSPDAAARLAALGVNNVDGRMDAARSEMQALRTVKLPQSGKGTAEFFLLLSPNKVDDVKFIQGDDALKSFTETLKTAETGMKFPPNSQAQVVRRAILKCGSAAPGPCSLELVPSTQVRTLD